MGGTAFIGWICYKSMEGTDEDMYRNAGPGEKKKADDKSKYNPNAMLVETLKKGGAADLG